MNDDKRETKVNLAAVMKQADNVVKLVQAAHMVEQRIQKAAYPKKKAAHVKSEKRVCAKCKKAPPKSVRSDWCEPCYKVRRTKQLKDNNVVWRKRVEAGTADHHLTYKARPTEWAAKNRSEAKKKAKAMMKEAEKKGQEPVIKLAKIALKVLG
jgi:hypothetical protein